MRARAHLDLVDVNLAVLLAHLLVGRLHGVDGRHRVAQIFSREGGLLHIERLLLELRDLALVELFLLQNSQRPLLDRVLGGDIRSARARTCVRQNPRAHLAWTVSHLAHLIAEFGQLGVKFADLDLDGIDPEVGRGDRIRQGRFRLGGRRAKDAVHGALESRCQRRGCESEGLLGGRVQCAGASQPVRRRAAGVRLDLAPQRLAPVRLRTPVDPLHPNPLPISLRRPSPVEPRQTERNDPLGVQVLVHGLTGRSSGRRSARRMESKRGGAQERDDDNVDASGGQVEGRRATQSFVKQRSLDRASQSPSQGRDGK